LASRFTSFIGGGVVNFREDGSSEVQLGETHVMGYVTAQLVQPYRDRPNEGTLAIFTEFSPMADPAFEPGRPGESAIELGRVIDRGLRFPGSWFCNLSDFGFKRGA
jgi:exosome complex RNA-binding protein Rrp42 (RNase PH superfamily)